MKIKDQFELHKGRGFLHPANPLAYTLRLRNRSEWPVKLFVSHGLGSV